MGAAGGSKGRHRINNKTNSATPSRDTPKSGRPTKPTFNAAAIQKAVAAAQGFDDKAVRTKNIVREVAGDNYDRHGGLTEITVHGLSQSKAASNIGGGIKELLNFLQRKASGAHAKPHEMLRIKKVRVYHPAGHNDRSGKASTSGLLSLQDNLQERRSSCYSSAIAAYG